MLTDLLTEAATLTADILEGMMLALVGIKPPKVRKARKPRQYRARRTARRTVFNDRAMQRLAGRLFENLPHDVAISVLNDVKRYGMEA
jgi:hypothetical protein